jgi:CRISPR-associated protein Csc1
VYITTCNLTLHDNLFYASREMGRMYETERYLHNYGLSYALGDALGLRRSYFNASQVPAYRDELKLLAATGIYITPARPLEYSFVFNTFKLGDPNYYNLTERTTENRIIYGRAKELAVGSRFEFFILSKAKLRLPHWVRLGKWMSKAELTIGTQGEYKAEQLRGAEPIACPLNPLDFAPAALISFDIVAMPPVSLLINAVTQQPCYNVNSRGKGGRDAVYIPANLAYFGAGG